MLQKKDRSNSSIKYEKTLLESERVRDICIIPLSPYSMTGQQSQSATNRVIENAKLLNQGKNQLAPVTSQIY